MDVTKNRDINKVIVLGSGMSILDLTDEEIAYINRCKTVIAVNKFMAFYEKSRIIPTHVYFYDQMGCTIFLYIVKKCLNDNLTGLTFFVSSYLNTLTYSKQTTLLYKIIVDLFRYRFVSLIVILLKLRKNLFGHKVRFFRKYTWCRLPKDSAIYVIHAVQVAKKWVWAKKINGTIFHHKGSLTSVLNIASIIAPNQEIILIGNDFNRSKYFYEDDLNASGIEWKDHTYNETKKQGIHFSFQNNGGGKMEDSFPFILENLIKNGNALSCNNKSSLLVERCGVPYKPLLP